VLKSAPDFFRADAHHFTVTAGIYRAKRTAKRDRAWSNACFANSICTKRQFLT
jgi:hypothetical protein